MSIGNHSDCIDEGRRTAQSRWCHSLAGVLDRVENENWAPPLSSCECHTVVTSHSPHLDLPTMMDHVPELSQSACSLVLSCQSTLSEQRERNENEQVYLVLSKMRTGKMY